MIGLSNVSFVQAQCFRRSDSDLGKSNVIEFGLARQRRGKVGIDKKSWFRKKLVSKKSWCGKKSWCWKKIGVGNKKWCQKKKLEPNKKIGFEKNWKKYEISSVEKHVKLVAKDVS